MLGDENGECFFCEKPVDQEVIVYQVEENKQIICLKSEAEELINKSSIATSNEAFCINIKQFHITADFT